MARGPKRSSTDRRKIAAQNNVRRPTQDLFSEEELNLLRTMDRFNKGEDAVEVLCGCTDKKYGDTTGTLTIFLTGKFMITCDCPLEHKNTESTDPKRMTLKEFECHARGGVRKWKRHIWVIKDGKKVPLKKSGLLRYYKHSANESNWDPCSSKFIHRDEFLCCCDCKKERRFRLRTLDECRAFHDASRNTNWRCADHHDKTNCDEEEERVGRKSYRSCPRAPACKGCTSCVCLGCSMCRFKDCDCRICVDYIQNVEP